MQQAWQIGPLALLGLVQPDQAVPAVTFGRALADVLLLAVAGYGAYLWLKWFRSWRKGDRDFVPLCFHRRVPRESPPIPLAPILLAGFWVASSLGSTLFRTASVEDLADGFPDISVLMTSIILVPVGISIVLLILWEYSGEKFRPRDYFLDPGWRAELQAGVELMLLAMPATILLGMLSTLWKTEDELLLLLRMLQSERDPQLLLVIVTSATLIAPLFEELLFRVLLLNGMMQQGRLSPVPAVWLVSAFFCLGHGIHDAMQLFPLSLCLGWCLVKRQSYVALICGHALFNGFMLTLTLLYYSGQ